MSDPYEILGVSRDATLDEIKAAHRRLSAQYHPDKFMNNPLRELAEEKLKLINGAWDAIKRERGGGGSAQGGDNRRSHGGSRQDHRDPDAAAKHVSELCAARRFSDALSEIDRAESRFGERPEWHSLRGTALGAMGRWQEAAASFQRALRFAPSDGETLIAHGTCLFHAGDFMAAVGVLHRARTSGHVRPTAMAMEAFCLERLGNVWDAKALFDEVRRQDPTNEILARRDASWKVGNTYVDKQEATGNACCLCVIIELLFDCL